MKEAGRNLRFIMKHVPSVLFLFFSFFIASQLVEGSTYSVHGKGGVPYFDREGDLHIVYINLDGGISHATLQEEKSRKKVSSQEIHHVNNVSTIHVKQNRQGRTWLVWEERHPGKSDIFAAQLQNQKILQPIGVSTNRRGYNFSPTIDFSNGNTPWIAWINYSRRKYRLFIKNLVADQTWVIKTPPKSSYHSPQIVIDGTKGLWLFWVGKLREHDEILCSRFERERWTKPISLNQSFQVPHIHPSVSLDSYGLPRVVWSAYDGEDYELYSSRWNGTEWRQEERITDNESIADTSPSLAFLLNSIPLVAWLSSENGERKIRLAYRLGENWSPPINISKGITITSPPKLAFFDDKIGLVWQTEEEIRVHRIHYHDLYDFLIPQTRPPHLQRSLVLDRDKYIGFGNSITYGTIKNEDAPEKGYIPRLEKLIDENITDSEVLNRGVSGEKTAEGLSRIDSVIEEDQAQTIFIMEGTNDVKDLGISTDTIAFNLKKMAEKARNFGMTVFLASIIPLDSVSEVIEQRVPELNEKIETAAFALIVDFVDQFEAFGGVHSGLLYSDSTHPNEKGYQLMAETWYDALIDTLPSIETNVTSLSFMAKAGEENPPPQMFWIRNSGAGSLHYQIRADKEWIGISPISGDSEGEWDEIEVSVDSSNLSRGFYQGEIAVSSEGTPNSPQILTVNLSISGPEIEVDPTLLAFEGIKGEGNPPSQIIRIRNLGEDVLHYQISGDKDWISLVPTSGRSEGEWDDVEVSVDISNLSKGEYEGQVIIASDNAGNSPQVVSIKLTVLSPIIELNKHSLLFKVFAGDPNPPPKRFKIRNSGAGTLNYKISADKNWVHVSPTSGDSEGEWDTIEVSVDILGLSPGNHEGQVTVTATHASNRPQTLMVNLRIQLPPLSPPSNFRGEKKVNRSLSQLEYINVLSWEANPKNRSIERYKIYLIQNNQATLLAEINAQTFFYWHRKAERARIYIYGLTAVDAYGRESEPVITEVR